MLCTLSCVLSLSAIWLFFKWRYSYWQRHNVPFLQPIIPFGNTTNPFKSTEHVGVTIKKHYQEMKSRGWRHGGIFYLVQPMHLLVDLEHVKSFMTTHFDHFNDRGIYYNEKNDPLSSHLFALSGAKWKRLRTQLSPNFTSNKMKLMLETMVKCGDNLQAAIQARENNPIDIRSLLDNFTIDIIGVCAFGLNCHTFKDENSQLRVLGRKASMGTKASLLKTMIGMNFPDLSRKLGLTVTPSDVEDFFINLVKDTVRYREKNHVQAHDFLQLMIDGGSLSSEEIAAQSFLFFVAGFDTSASAMSFALYELSKRRDLQSKVRNEMARVLGDGPITYAALQKMSYLEQVVSEALRMYPSLPFTVRKCSKDYKLSDEDVVVKKGTMVTIPILGIHWDHKYYPNPHHFDPERFNEDNKSRRHRFAYLPFGDGPRRCIGMRFAMMQSKVGLATLLRYYEFSVSTKTQEPVELEPSSFILRAKHTLWLDAHKI